MTNTELQLGMDDSCNLQWEPKNGTKVGRIYFCLYFTSEKEQEE